MPRCDCATRLASPPLPPSVVASDGRDDDDDDDAHPRRRHPSDVLSGVGILTFRNLATCRTCLARLIAASGEVTTHDYRMSGVPNGQRDAPFTVGLACAQCRRKFSARGLGRLLLEDGARRRRRRATASAGGGATGGGGGGRVVGGSDRGKKSDADVWRDAVEATIALVGWAKRDMRGEARRVRRLRRRGDGGRGGGGREERLVGGGGGGDDADRRRTAVVASRWGDDDAARGFFTGGDGNCSSDECYTLSSPSDCSSGHDDDGGGGGGCSNDEDRGGFAARRRSAGKGPRRVELEAGELMRELLRKDPLFRQEREDEEYARRIAGEGDDAEASSRAREEQERANEDCARRIAEEEEGEWRRAIEARSREDRELAIKLQEKLDGQKEKAAGGRGVTTRSSSSSRSTILDSWKMSPSSSSDKKSGGDESPGAPLRRDRGVASASSALSPRAVASVVEVSSMSPTLSPSPEKTTVVDQGPKPGEQSEHRSVADDVEVIRMDGTSVDEILAMGFSESSARRCLTDANGNVQLAVSMLLSEASEAGRQ